MKKTAWILLLIVTTLFISAPAQTVPVKPKTDTLTVVNEDGKSFEFTAADLARLPRRQLKSQDHNGVEIQLEGYGVTDILKLAGVKLGGNSMRGKRLAQYLLVEAADNYRTLFSLTEFDPDYTGTVILLADKLDGKPLTTEFAPWYLIVPDQKMHGRWAREVVKLSIKTAEPSVALTSGNANDEEAIYELRFRKILKKWAEGDNGNFYLQLANQKDPGDALLKRLGDTGKPLRKGSESFISEPDGAAVLDKVSKKRGVLVLIYKFDWISKDEAKVVAGDHVGNMGASDCTYRVRRETDGWKIYRKERCTIS